jgi:hypothetical protein
MLVPSLAPRFSEGTNSQTEMIAVVLTASEETVATPHAPNRQQNHGKLLGQSDALRRC